MMDPHETSEASGAEPEADLEKIVSRWAGESRQLLLALPVVLARLQELRDEREALRNRLMDLEQENLTLRESRENLTETFAKLKDLIAGTALDETQRHLGLELVERASTAEPEPPVRDAASPPPAKAPVPPTTPAPSPPKPEPAPLAARPEPNPQSAPAPSPPASPEKPPQVRFTRVFRPPTKK